ncbi:succinoglycan biosynthesis protein exop [Halobiforma lacisalsi AJ5]|uniref:Succinoglycan biosynthesis protein exop n=1 Tax=Natronobacterium lacisalsi AJ5 TaxID=358396 RepID=M0LSY9_NATLA|nr:lipopolysaccharide biosynthesis protein [Halobiforma lacisalsi]APW99335.1 succinoglycan biosynthesis protein exop [Halobiforma lacisalsi AJ5]EMA35235.1 succinoglycan biosynthesis transport protein [Halobiforma lacisalsi AJ5]
MSSELREEPRGEEQDGADPGAEPETETEPRTDVAPDEREALLTIAHGAVVTSGGVSVQRGLVAATEFVLARGLGPVAYGVYALAWRIAQLLVRLVTFGSVPTLQRYVPAFEDDPARRSRVAGLAYATTTGFGLAIAAAVWVLAPRIDAATVDHPSFPPAMRLFGVLVLLLGVLMIYAALFRAVGSARGEVIFNKLLRPAVRLVGALVALALGYSVVGVAGAFVACAAALVIVGFPATTSATGIRPRLRGARAEVRRFYDHAAPVAMSSLGKVFQNRVDILLVGALLSATAAGVYNVVLVLISIAWIPLLSFNQLLPPVASELHSSDRMETLNAVYSSVTRLIVTAVVPVLAVQAVFGRELLALFGATYARGYLPLVVYLGGVFVGSAVGATGWLLMMTDHQYARMALDWLLAALNVTLTYAFVSAFGLVGAALGTSLAIAVQNSLQVLLLRRFEGLWPFDATYLKPLGGGVVMAGAMLGVRSAADGAPAVAVGMVVGLLAYVATLHLLGVDPRDRLVVSELAVRYREDLVGIMSRYRA